MHAVHARGLCSTHYNRKQREGGLAPLPASFSNGNVEAFWEKVKRTDSCWEWTASKTAAGYGNLRLPTGGNGYAHRVSFELSRGPIPEGKVIDHLCRNRSCVNPEHLEPVDQLTNVLRGAVPYGPLRPACRNGHDITNPQNVYQRPTGARLCRICSRDHTKRSRAKKKELR